MICPQGAALPITLAAAAQPLERQVGSGHAGQGWLILGVEGGAVQLPAVRLC